jgi:hypothetical protein
MTRGRLLRLVFAPAATLLAAACGDIHLDAPGSSSVVVAKGGSGSSSSATVPQDMSGFCPSARPEENTRCDTVGATCEYGHSPDISCNATLACEGNPEDVKAWTPRPSRLCPIAECPQKGTAIAALDGQPCAVPAGADGGPPGDDDELICDAADGLCACTTGPDASHAHPRMWVCVKPSAGCPSSRPLIGQPCTGANLCDYGSCSFKRGLWMQCNGSAWFTRGSPACG